MKINNGKTDAKMRNKDCKSKEKKDSTLKNASISSLFKPISASASPTLLYFHHHHQCYSSPRPKRAHPGTLERQDHHTKKQEAVAQSTSDKINH
jgi:hypothetical protein